MSEPTEIIIDPNHQLLRLYCGQCGDPKDLIFDINKINGRITILIGDSVDMNDDDHPEHLLTPTQVII